jgi:hypothetical protein
MAARTIVLAIFGTIGFAIGFLSFLASPGVAAAFASILPQLDKSIAFALVSGIAGAAISTTVVSVWAKRP